MLNLQVALAATDVVDLYEQCQVGPRSDATDLVHVQLPGDKKYFFLRTGLESARSLVTALLLQLPVSFTQGNGSPIEDAIQDRRGVLWTRDDEIARDLLRIGVALGIVRATSVTIPDGGGLELHLYRITVDNV